MDIKKIKKVLVAGAGTMGQQIAAQCALHGYDVVLYDLDQAILDQAIARMEKLLVYFVKHKMVDEHQASAAKDRLTAQCDLQKAAADVDIVSESVPEDPQIKGKLFSQLNEMCPKHTIFTTNTSTLLPSELAPMTGRPDKLVALHFHDTRVTNIVDVMAHPDASAETMQTVAEFARSIGQVPIVLRKESSGYVFNAMLSAWFHAAQTLAANGVTSVEEVDRAWIGVTRMSMGPFAMMDSVGIDTVWKVTDHQAEITGDPQYKQNAYFLKTYIDQGLLGQKSGKGFYQYPDPTFKQPGFAKGKKI